MNKIRVRGVTREAARDGTARLRQRHAILTDTPVTTVMSRPAVCVRADEPLDDALRVFAAAGVRHLAVVNQDGQCVGLLSDRVLTGAWALDPMAFTRLPVATLIGPDEPLLPHTATIVAAARAMHRHGTDAVAVVDDDRIPIGVLTATDVIALVAKPAR